MSAVAIGFSNFCAGFDLDDRELLLLRDEQLLAVERHLEPVGIVEHRLLFALLEVEEDDRALLVARAGARQAAVEQLALDRLQVGVVAGLRRQHDGARLEAVEIDVDVRAGAGGRFSAGFRPGFFVRLPLSVCRLRLALAFSASLRAASGDLTSLRSGTATSCVGLGYVHELSKLP